jgi:hypothetical protein
MEKQSHKGKVKGLQVFIWALLLSCLFELMHFLLCFELSHKNIKNGIWNKKLVSWRRTHGRWVGSHRLLLPTRI